MKTLLSLIATLAAATLLAQSPVSFTGSYTEDFDSMGPTGTSYPNGWIGIRYAGTGGAGSLTLTDTTGTATTGGLYNVGASGDSDRALGTLASGTTIPRFGVQLANNSGTTFDQIIFSGVSEQWRTGNNATANESVAFEYSFNAADINDQNATFLPLASMNLAEVQTASTSGGAINGNDPANQMILSGAITGANWADGTTLTIRWSDVDDTGNDGMYALDNFNITAVPEPSTIALLGLGVAGLLARRVRR